MQRNSHFGLPLSVTGTGSWKCLQLVLAGPLVFWLCPFSPLSSSSWTLTTLMSALPLVVVACFAHYNQGFSLKGTPYLLGPLIFFIASCLWFICLLFLQ